MPSISRLIASLQRVAASPASAASMSAFPKRAAVALILRRSRAVEVAAGSDDFTAGSSLAAAPTAPPAAARAPSARDALELLFIKRTAHEGDPWSGQVAFPGGKREADDADDVACAVRETREEVGIDLSCEDNFQFLGRLGDRAVFAGGTKLGGFALCPFVFLYKGDARGRAGNLLPELTLSSAEVDAGRWVSLEVLRRENVRYDQVERPYALKWLFPRAGPAIPRALVRALGLTHVAFPSIPLPHHASQRCGDGEDRPSARFELWGMTLRMAADLVAFASAGGGPMPRGTRSVAHDAVVDWPPVKFPGNRAASALVGGLARGVGAWRRWRDSSRL